MSAFDENGIALIGNGNGQAKPPSVLIAIPSQDTWKAQFGYSLALMRLNTIASQPECEVSIVLHRATLLPDQRQWLAQEAIDQGASHILYLDTDMTFPPHTLLHLLSRDADIVAANYVARRHPVKPVAVSMNEEGKLYDLYTEPDAKGLHEVVWVGMGIMLVKTEVFKKLPKPWFHLEYNPKTQRFNGEDVWFCRTVHSICKRCGVSTYQHQGVGHEFESYHIFVDQDLSNHRDEQGRYTITHIGDHQYSPADASAVREQLGRPQLVVGGDTRNVRSLTAVP